MLVRIPINMGKKEPSEQEAFQRVANLISNLPQWFVEPPEYISHEIRPNSDLDWEVEVTFLAVRVP